MQTVFLSRRIGQKFVQYLGQSFWAGDCIILSGFGPARRVWRQYCSSSARHLRGIAKFAVLTVDEQRFTQSVATASLLVDHKQRKGRRQVQRVCLN